MILTMNPVFIEKIIIKKFETEQAFSQWRQSEDCELPQLSWCVTEDTIKSEALITPPQHDYVEIGGIKWATMNVGATAVTDSGLYFQWGDTQGYTTEQCGSGEGQKYFGWEDYKYCNGASEPGATGMTKYNAADGLLTLEASDDAVHAAWGGKWRMPTSAETAALGAAVTTAWVSNYEGSGVAGRVCTDKTDSSKVLFFPTAGCCSNGGVYYVGSKGLYWSGSLHSSRAQSGRNMNFFGGSVRWTDEYTRRMGLTVRGILDE